MSLTIKCVDLFCGCGGMSLGFEASGFNIVAGIDNWKAAIRVYEKNFDHPIIEKDLMDVEVYPRPNYRWATMPGFFDCRFPG